MKIAYVYDGVYPYVIGGVEKRNWELAVRLVRRGHEVTLFGMKFWKGDDILVTPEGVRLYGICPPKKQFTEGRRSIKQAIYFAYKVLAPLSKEKFDIIDAASSPYFPCFSAKLVSLWKKHPLIITWHELWNDYWYDYLGNIKGFIGKTVERMTLKLPNIIISVSEKVERDLLSIGVDEKKIMVVPNGIDFEKIQGIKPADSEYDVIFAGGLIKHKNVDVLIKAIDILKKKMPGVKCAIIGDGPERKNLSNIVRKLNLEKNVEFLGFLKKHDDVISYMKSSKVFVFPSNREGFGIAALEANACGLPVITVDHPRNAACDWIINNENGLIGKLSEREIAEEMLAVLDGRKCMREKCIEYAKRFDWAAITDLTILGIYQEVLK